MHLFVSRVLCPGSHSGTILLLTKTESGRGERSERVGGIGRESQREKERQRKEKELGRWRRTREGVLEVDVPWKTYKKKNKSCACVCVYMWVGWSHFNQWEAM